LISASAEILFSPARPADELGNIIDVTERYCLFDITNLIQDTVRTAWHAATFGWRNIPALSLSSFYKHGDEDEDEASNPPFPSPVRWLELAISLAISPKDESTVRSIFMFIWSVGSISAERPDIKAAVKEGLVSEREMNELWRMYQLIEWNKLGEREMDVLALINDESVSCMDDIEAWGLLPVVGEYCGTFVRGQGPGQVCPRMCNTQAGEMLRRIGRLARLTGKTHVFLRTLCDILAPCHGNNGILCRVGDRINSPGLDPDSLMSKALDPMCNRCRAHLRDYTRKVRFGVDAVIKDIVQQYMAQLHQQ
jgi:hypothetical protein